MNDISLLVIIFNSIKGGSRILQGDADVITSFSLASLFSAPPPPVPPESVPPSLLSPPFFPYRPFLLIQVGDLEKAMSSPNSSERSQTQPDALWGYVWDT